MIRLALACDTAAALRSLFIRHDNIEKDFYNNIRAHNGAFAFTSMDVNLDKNLANGKI